MFSYRLGLNFVLLFEELDHHNLILLFCFIFFFREICGQKAVFLVIRFTSTLAWRVKSMMSLTGQRARYIYTLGTNS